MAAARPRPPLHYAFRRSHNNGFGANLYWQPQQLGVQFTRPSSPRREELEWRLLTASKRRSFMGATRFHPSSARFESAECNHKLLDLAVELRDYHFLCCHIYWHLGPLMGGWNINRKQCSCTLAGTSKDMHACPEANQIRDARMENGRFLFPHNIVCKYQLASFGARGDLQTRKSRLAPSLE